MADPKIEAMRRVPLFARCSAKQLQSLSARLDEVEVEAGTVMTTEGRPAHSFSVIVSGQAEVTISGDRRATLGPGDFFGEISMIDREPATATVTTTQACELLVMSHQQFRDALADDGELALIVMQAMAARLRANESDGYQRPGWGEPGGGAGS